MISGFLLWNEDPEKFRRRVFKNLKNIVKITILAELLYFAYLLFCFHSCDIYLRSFVNWLFFNSSPNKGFHLWYLYAYIYVLIIIYFLSKWKVIQKLKYAVPFLLFVFVFVGKYSFLFKPNLDEHYSMNFLFDGLPFFTIGLFTKQNFEIIKEKIRHPILLPIMFLFLSFVEMFIIRGENIVVYGSSYISTPFYAFFLFIAFILSSQWKENWLSWIGKELSLYIYIFHVMIGYKLQNIEALKPIFDNFGALFVLLFSILFSYLFVKIKSFIVSKIS